MTKSEELLVFDIEQRAREAATQSAKYASPYNDSSSFESDVARQYSAEANAFREAAEMVRRYFAARSLPDSILLIANERRRHIDEEGWSLEHDDEHDRGELGLAAALYALPYDTTDCDEPLLTQDDFIGLQMALEISCNWVIKPEPDKLRRMIKAGSLIAAEIERLRRAQVPTAEGVKDAE